MADMHSRRKYEGVLWRFRSVHKQDVSPEVDSAYIDEYEVIYMHRLMPTNAEIHISL